ncbi:MAG: sugar ABC transporter substrate-binding protein, partial [Actinobacteria bacterium]|nr:sugar ABC transporter substrate-binding protein [Actinomycetota bacterium]
MSKIKMILLIGIVVALVFTILILPACKPEEAAAPETVIVKETVIETVIETVEVEKEAVFTYEENLEYAASGEPWPGEPAKGHKLAFANILAAQPFCQAVENSIIEQWKLAGGAEEDLLVMDNAVDVNLAVQNADMAFNFGPEVFIEFQIDYKLNANIAKRADEAGIEVIYVDVPGPAGTPYMGVNPYAASVMAGEFAAGLVDSALGGWDNVDLVTWFWNPNAGDHALARQYGAVETFKEKFGESADPSIKGSKALYGDSGSGTEEENTQQMAAILAANPDAEIIIHFNMNDQGGAGAYAAAQTAGRWDPDKWLIITHGLDDLGKQLVRDNVVDGDVAYFPERYGWYLVAGAVAYMNGNPIPPNMYVE